MLNPKEYADILGCTMVALDDSKKEISKLESEVQRLEHTVLYWKIEANTNDDRWNRQMEENARLRADLKASDDIKASLASSVLKLGDELRKLTK